jgi:superfamily I DNA and/or RNA helicase
MNFTLNNHYRSVNEQLIKFSSYYFYNDELVCITKNGNFKSAVEVINEMGQYDREHGINTQEANRVIQTILAYHDIYKTIIVITFNIKQANYIQQLAYAQPKLSKRLEMLTLKIRSLESVQGDEGDLIIISCTFGKDKEGKFIQNFGPVNQDGGKNRINVMASRAKEKMIVIKSFMSNELTNVHNENSLIFKNFINYVEEANNTPTENLVEKMVSSSSDIDNVINELINELSLNQNLLVQKHKQIGTHMIDLAISKLNDPKIALCILIDGQYRNEIYEKDNKQ